MGYGQPHNTIQEIGTSLFARALFIKNELNEKVILVHLEQAFVSLAIKEEIIKRLSVEFPEWQITNANLMITAQHTHSAPGGYSHYPFYNFTIPNFQLSVFHTLCDGIMGAIKTAFKNHREITIHWGKHFISEDKEVAFNRSMKSHLKNEGAAQIRESETHLGVNREMEALHFVDLEGQSIAMVNWFGVHCTSISSFNHKIHHDNKGVAASLYEKAHSGTIAFFMQAAAGDVSPNFIWDKDLGRTRGKFKDQYENADFNGELQFREAEKIQNEKQLNSSHIKCFHQFFDMAKNVAPAAHGVAFFEGTKEGPGVNPLLGSVLKTISRFVRQKKLITHPELHKDFYEAHFPKDVLLDHRSGAFLGIPLSIWKKLPAIPEPAVEALRLAAKKESINTLPWVPEILPFQIIILGPILIAAVPGEITTTAAKRLKDAIAMNLESDEVERIIISSYSNAYMGYITTPEEYMTQSYEAGHTVYGRHTLEGIKKGFIELISEFQGKKVPSNTCAFQFPTDELKRRTT